MKNLKESTKFWAIVIITSIVSLYALIFGGIATLFHWATETVNEANVESIE
jgi:hypothetical protein